MKKLKIATIALLIGTALCLCALLILALAEGGNGHAGDSGDSFSFREGDYRVVLEKEIAPEGIKGLKIDYGMTFNDVYFYSSEAETIVIRECMNFTPKENQVSRVEQDGGTLLVKGAKRRNFGFFFSWNRNAYTEVYLPGDLAENLEEIYLKTVSGEIYADIPLAAQGKFSASSTSGDICFQEIKADEVQVSSTSGNLYLMENILAKKLAVSTTSGDINVGQLEGGAKVSSTSGNVRMDGILGDADVSTVSGDISLGTVEGSTEISTTSGRVWLQEGKDGFKGSTVSGDIWIEMLEGIFRINTSSGNISLSGGNGGGEVETTSGDVEITLADLAGELAASTTSGNVEVALEKLAGKFEASTTSGDVEVAAADLAGDITVSSTSGSVELQLPGTASARLDFDSTSGGCSTFFDEQLRFSKRGNQAEGQYGSGDYEIRVSTASGDLRIMEY